MTYTPSHCSAIIPSTQEMKIDGDLTFLAHGGQVSFDEFSSPACWNTYNLNLPNHCDQLPRRLWPENFYHDQNRSKRNFVKNETLRHSFASECQNIDLTCAYVNLTTHKHNISQPWNSWKILLLSTCAFSCLLITHHYWMKKDLWWSNVFGKESMLCS